VISGLGLNTRRIADIVGVMKAYTTRVGSGPMPTEQRNEVGERLQKIGGEVGVSTGRTRRCGKCPYLLYLNVSCASTAFLGIARIDTGLIRSPGWLDLMVIRYAHRIDWYTQLNLTKLDVLDSFAEIKVAVAYRNRRTGEDIPSFPADLSVLEDPDFEVVYHTMKGWEMKTSGIRNFDDLPPQARAVSRFFRLAISWLTP
jgi:adenylosuccinate synthase